MTIQHGFNYTLSHAQTYFILSTVVQTDSLVWCCSCLCIKSLLHST